LEQTAASAIIKQRCASLKRAAAAQRAVSLKHRLGDWRLRAARLGPRGPLAPTRACYNSSVPALLDNYWRHFGAWVNDFTQSNNLAPFTNFKPLTLDYHRQRLSSPK
jgi:hypothetical protein